ncbi:hypothetical protein Ancab_002913 [Ancistrocladus abbreviatus]
MAISYFDYWYDGPLDNYGWFSPILSPFLRSGTTQAELAIKDRGCSSLRRKEEINQRFKWLQWRQVEAPLLRLAEELSFRKLEDTVEDRTRPICSRIRNTTKQWGQVWLLNLPLPCPTFSFFGNCMKATVKHGRMCARWQLESSIRCFHRDRYWSVLNFFSKVSTMFNSI